MQIADISFVPELCAGQCTEGQEDLIAAIPHFTTPAMPPLPDDASHGAVTQAQRRSCRRKKLFVSRYDGRPAFFLGISQFYEMLLKVIY